MWQTVNGIHSETVTIGLVSDGQLERGINVSLLFVSSDVEVELTWTLVGESVDEPWVGVEVEHDWPVVGEDVCPLLVRHSVGMVGVGDKLEEIDDVNKSDLEFGKELSEESGGSERLLGRNITAGCHDEIWLLSVVVGGEVPDTETLGAMGNGFLHVEELEMVLLIGNDDVDVVG